MTRSRIECRLAALCGAVAMALFMVAFVAAGPGLAHSYLQQSTPADGAVLKKAPKQLTLTFSEDVRTQGAGLSVRTADGATTLAPVVRGDVVTAAWPPDVATGKVEADYRIVSEDGHVMTGTIAFRIQPPAAESPSAVDAPEPAVSPSDLTDSTAANDTHSPAGVPTWVLGLGGLIALAGVVGVLLTRRNQDRW